MGTAERVMLAVAAALVAAAVVLGSDSSGEISPRRGGASAADVPRIARRVELLRGLDFRRVPRRRLVTPAQARAEALRQLDDAYPVRARRADEETLKLLGLLPPRADLRRISAAVYGEQVAGYYDPRSKRLSVVRGSGGFGTEIVLAHELNHALEDQAFGIRDPRPGTDDRATAEAAIVEGTATALMVDYARRYRGSSSLGDAIGSLGDAAGGQTTLPRYVQDSLEFPYLGGLAFVTALRRRTGMTWKLVDEALRARWPSTTEQILHPRRWLAREGAEPVRTAAGPVLRGRGFARRAAGELGEWDTRELLLMSLDAKAAGAAAAGWGGGRYELWQRARPHEGCATPCRRADALVLAWRWDTAADARAFATALTAWLPTHLRARPLGGGSWAVGDGSAALAARPRATSLAFAPTAPLAARLARRASR